MFTIELANGRLPTRAHHRLSGHETWLGSGTLEPTALDKIHDRLVALLDGPTENGEVR